jgi:hypothetical protein
VNLDEAPLFAFGPVVFELMRAAGELAAMSDDGVSRIGR